LLGMGADGITWLAVRVNAVTKTVYHVAWALALAPTFTGQSTVTECLHLTSSRASLHDH
jgi:hypothetical protein